MQRNSSVCLRFLGWLFLLQLSGELIGLAVLYLTFDPFADGAAMYGYGLFMLPLWAVWGWFTPKSACPGGKRTGVILAMWTALIGILAMLLPDYRLLFAMPQQMAGVGLARLVPVHYGSALYFNAVEPTATAAAYMLLPALLALGLFVRHSINTKTNG